MAEYTHTVCDIPVTRWKSRTRGIKPAVAPMSKLVDCTPKSAPNIPAVNSPCGYKTTGLVAALPTEPKGKGPEFAIQWLQYADAMTSVAFGLESFKVVGITLQSEPEPIVVPRGTFIGPRFEHQAKRPIVQSRSNSTVVPASSKQASSIGNF